MYTAIDQSDIAQTIHQRVFLTMHLPTRRMMAAYGAKDQGPISQRDTQHSNRVAHPVRDGEDPWARLRVVNLISCDKVERRW